MVKNVKSLVAMISMAFIMCVVIPTTPVSAAEPPSDNTFISAVTLDDGVTTVAMTFMVLTEPSGGENGTVQVGNGYDVAIDRATSGGLTIPNKVTYNSNDYTVTSIGRESFRETALTSVVIPDSVTSIGDSAFIYTTLTSVTIGTGVKTISNNAFAQTALTSVTIPDSVTSIGDSAFIYTPLTSVTIGTGVKTISNNAFRGTSLTSVTIPDSVTSIGGNAFDYQNKAGHTFGGWYSDSDFGTSFDFSTERTETTTVYVKWNINSYTVTFNTNGGSSVNQQTVVYGNKATEPTTPTKDGHTFDGWYKDEALTTPWNFGTDTVSANTTVYAKWLTNYTVTFNSNGGSLLDPQAVADTHKLIEPTTPTKDGYTFDGWYKDEALTTAWDFGTDTISDNTTVYAKWNINSYTVTFNTNGGSSVISQTVVYGNKPTEPTMPTKDRHTFDGWYIDEALTLVWNFGTDTVSDNTTVYAKWNINSYTVTFNTNGGSSVDQQTVVYGNKPTEPTTPTKDGYTFDGWYKDEALTTPWVFGLDIISDNTTIYASWIENSKITDGADQTIEKGQALKVTASGEYAGYIRTEITINGETKVLHNMGEANNSNISVMNGSIIVTLSGEYTKTLPVGTHTLSIVSENGTATTNFTVKEPVATTSPDTGDNSNTALLTAVMLSALGTSTVLLKRKAR